MKKIIIKKDFENTIFKTISKNIILNVEVKNFKDAIKKILHKIIMNNQDINFSETYKKIIERENLFSTSFGNNLAIPHCKTNSISNLIGGIGIFKKGIKYNSPDGKPVNIIIVLLSPDCISGPHIKFMAKMCEKFKKKNFTTNLLLCNSEKSVAKYILY